MRVRFSFFSFLWFVCLFDVLFVCLGFVFVICLFVDVVDECVCGGGGGGWGDTERGRQSA